MELIHDSASCLHAMVAKRGVWELCQESRGHEQTTMHFPSCFPQKSHSSQPLVEHCEGHSGEVWPDSSDTLRGVCVGKQRAKFLSRCAGLATSVLMLIAKATGYNVSLTYDVR